MVDMSSVMLLERLRAFNDLVKYRVANVGEVHTWGGHKMRKTPQGWEPVQDSRSSVSTGFGHGVEAENLLHESLYAPTLKDKNKKRQAAIAHAKSHIDELVKLAGRTDTAHKYLDRLAALRGEIKLLTSSKKVSPNLLQGVFSRIREVHTDLHGERK